MWRGGKASVAPGVAQGMHGATPAPARRAEARSRQQLPHAAQAAAARIAAVTLDLSRLSLGRAPLAISQRHSRLDCADD
jgi:hypothetical protein